MRRISWTRWMGMALVMSSIAAVVPVALREVCYALAFVSWVVTLGRMLIGFEPHVGEING